MGRWAQAYKRPVEKPKPPGKSGEAPAAEHQMTGAEAMDFLHKAVDNEQQELCLSAARDKAGLGFLFFYELLTGTICVSILGGDDCVATAATLLRLLPEGDTARAACPPPVQLRTRALPIAPRGTPRSTLPRLSCSCSCRQSGVLARWTAVGWLVLRASRVPDRVSLVARRCPRRRTAP